VGYAGHVVHSGASRVRNVNALFFILGRAWYGFHKKRAGTHYAELVLLFPVGSVGHVVPLWCIRGMKRRHTVFHARVGSVWFHQKCAGTQYVKLVFLRPLGSGGHVVHFGASGT
jgi:hypothetical protein